MRRIDGTGDDLGPDGVELGNAVAEGQDLGRADVGEAQRVEKEDQVLSSAAIKRDQAVNLKQFF
jgi:hypothetical protein